LNPGYDPHLPLYRPWPMFDAIRDANLNRSDSPWAIPPPDLSKSEPSNVAATNSIFYLPENAAHLVQDLAPAGVKPLPYSGAVRPDFLLVDGALDANSSATQPLKIAVDSVLASGGTVWIWNINPAGADILSKWFGGEIQAAPHVASSFVVKQDNALLSGLDNANLYFSEDDDWRQTAFGLGGKVIEKASVVLEACPADWRKWNYQGEPVKTAALFRSEVEDTSPRAVIVEFPSQHGRVILCNLGSQVDSTRKAEIVGQLFRNEGVQTEKMAARSDFISFNGRLMRALVCGSFPFSDTNDPYSHRMPAGAVKPGAILDGQKWTLASANKNGVFDFRNGLVNGPTQDAVAYVAVWIKSPKPLNDLLSEPNLPKLSFTYGSDDGCEMWLNGDLLATHDRHGPLDPEMFSQNPLLLHLGWNLLVAKVVQYGGEWQFAGKFSCSDASFLSKLEFAPGKPDSE
jgi:beta-galactosidase